MPELKIEVRDRRNGNWFWCQNLVLKAKIAHTIKLTYFALCTYANKNTESCFPGMRKLAKIAGVSQRSVASAIQILKKSGIIKVKKGGGRSNSNEYSLLKINSAKIAQLETVQKEALKLCKSRHINSEPGEAKQRVLTNEINNKGMGKLKKKIKSLKFR